MNILHITTFLTGGAGRIVYDLASMQKSLGHDVTVLTSIDEDSGCINYEEYTLGLKDKGIELSGVNSIFKRDIYKNINAANKAREIINLKKIDIIHAHAAVPGLVGVIARSGNKKYIPVIQTMHGWGTNKTQEHEKMDVTVMNGLDSIIAVSMSDKVLLEDKGVNSDRIKVIYNGINEETFIPDSEDDVFKELSAYKNMGYSIIGCIGTVCQRKNQQLLLNAFAKVSNKVKSVCVFIGEGDIIPILRERAKEMEIEEQVRFYGYREKASKYLKKFDCFVLPSNSEGLPLTMIEAFRDKVPVVVSNIPIFEEIIEDKKKGFLFKANDIDSLVSVLTECLSLSSRDRLEMLQYANSGYVKNFTTKKMFKSYLDVYSKLLKS